VTIGSFLFDGLANGRMPMDLVTDELLQIRLAPNIELIADPGKLVGATFGYFQCKQFYLATINHHDSTSPALYLS
jgi:hypothetical protein